MPKPIDEPRGAGPAPRCPLVTDAVAFVQGEIPPAERERYTRHLRNCPACADEVRGARAVLDALRESSRAVDEAISPRPAADLVPRVLAALDGDIRRGSTRWRKSRRWIPAAAALAAALACAALGVLALRPAPVNEGPPVASAPASPEALAPFDEALAWLGRSQEPSGGWKAARWGGNESFDVGLTGLAALAFLARPGAEPDPGASLDGAIAFLLGRQEREGRIGPDCAAALYNHGIAAVALLEAYGLSRREDLRDPIERAIAYIRRIQSSDGGWGYLGSAEASNTSTTCWPLQALLLARALGWKDLDGPIAAGLGRLARVVDDSGRAGYRQPGEFPNGHEALTMMGAFCTLLAGRTQEFPEKLRARLLDEALRAASLPPGSDLYRDFFASQAAAFPRSSPSRPRPPSAPEALLATQVRNGPERGSWEPRDRWAATGGRVYATALGALILRADQRGPRLAGWTGNG